MEHMDGIIHEWILQCESLINHHCRRTFVNEMDPDTLNVIRNVCTRLVTNMINLSQIRSDAPLRKAKDWDAESVKDEIFPLSLKEDLKHLVVDKSTISDRITFFAVRGKP